MTAMMLQAITKYQPKTERLDSEQLGLVTCLTGICRALVIGSRLSTRGMLWGFSFGRLSAATPSISENLVHDPRYMLVARFTQSSSTGFFQMERNHPGCQT
jgi:hypothetical protein